MKTGLLLITHGQLGQDMLDTTTTILGNCPLRVKAIPVEGDCEPDVLLETASQACTELDQGDGVLVLTDLFGSTPSNIATLLMDTHPVYVISGVNIPMLLRVMNYPDLGLGKLAEKAASGAHDGVIVTTDKQASRHAGA
jgi:PTS system ascorbate-specific IIA component